MEGILGEVILRHHGLIIVFDVDTAGFISLALVFAGNFFQPFFLPLLLFLTLAKCGTGSTGQSNSPLMKVGTKSRTEA